MTRFDFGNSLLNTPTGFNYGNIGNLNIPDAFSLINVNSLWYGYIINEGSNTITRLDFGSSLINTPVATNIGNPGGLNGPRGITVFTECNKIVGLIVNRYSNDLINLNFTSGPTGPIIGTSLGNLANFSFPHSIERFRVGDTLYAFIPNVSNNTLSRIYYPSCTNSSIPSSTLQTPPAISYNTPGIYEINLTVDEGLITQTNMCKQIVVVPSPIVNLGNDTSILCGNQLTLNAGNPGMTYLWSTGATTQQINVSSAGTYWVKVTNGGGCVGIDSINVHFINPVANFSCPDTICVNTSFTIQNLTTCGSTYYWNFCSGNLSTNPIGTNIGNLGTLSMPVYSAIVKDGSNYFVFITNHSSGTLTRLSFGNSLNNVPVATNLGSLGMLSMYIEGIQIKKDSLTGNWYGLICGGQNFYIIRLNFGNSLMNIPTATNLGNIGSLLNYPHSIYTFLENGNWYSLVGNQNGNNIIRLSFGNSLSNTPTAVNLGNVGSLNYVIGLYPIQANGLWYLFVVNRLSNSISRLDFGNSLLNIPAGVNLGTINNTMNYPRSITIFRDCNQIFGFVVNETTNDIVRLTFPAGITSTPIGTSLGNIANFSFPHNISELYRVGDSVYNYVLNVTNSTISKLCYTSCTNASIPSSTLFTPPAISYNTPGIYNINLTVNEGLPSQTNFCKQIVVIAKPIVNLGNDTTLCAGGTVILKAGNPGSTYLWNTGATTQQITVANTGTYWVKVLNSGGCIATDTINISFYNLNVNLGNDTSICIGDSIKLNAGIGGSIYQWSTGATTQTITVGNAGTYWVNVVNGNCNSSDTIHLAVYQKPTVYLGNDTIMCPGDLIVLNAGSGFMNYLWSTGSTQSILNVNNPGTYTVTVSNGGCKASDQITIEECNSEIWIPNVFTPNGDGYNDTFYPVYTNIDKLTMYVYNRWGNQIFEGSGKAAVWDGTYMGKKCPDGVYYYLIDYEKKGGSNIGKKQLHGSVTLLN